MKVFHQEGHTHSLTLDLFLLISLIIQILICRLQFGLFQSVMCLIHLQSPCKNNMFLLVSPESN